MDELVSHLQRHCVEEPLLNILHCLLHADDTAILSTDRTLFKKKCNAMLKYFNDHSLGLNFPKSSYLIINGGEDDVKCGLQLDFGTLEYNATSVYLGGVVSDTGNISHDIEEFVNGKRPNVTVKYNNFVRKNYLAPLHIKLIVLDVCVASTLVYACETWGKSNVSPVEVTYRFGLKRALSIRDTTNTEIVYVEADRYPLSSRIAKQQLKFWISLNTYLAENPEHPLAGLIEHGRRIHLKYLAYYDNLEREYQNPDNCQKCLHEKFRSDCAGKIRQNAGNDEDSRFGVYHSVNPQLTPPAQRSDVLEVERIVVSRYRSGSHNLRIETGRMCNPSIPREERMCCCNSGIQSLQHIFFDCPLLAELHEEFAFTSIEEAFHRVDIARFFIQMERKLGINV